MSYGRVQTGEKRGFRVSRGERILSGLLRFRMSANPVQYSPSRPNAETYVGAELALLIQFFALQISHGESGVGRSHSDVDHQATQAQQNSVFSVLRRICPDEGCLGPSRHSLHAGDEGRCPNRRSRSCADENQATEVTVPGIGMGTRKLFPRRYE